MYNEFFGFKDKPFKLVPDPEYLFLSKNHQKALNHFSKAVSNGEEFVKITGEVGTGKTTLCKTLLHNLKGSMQSAYISDPNPEPLQLLKTINYELGIDSAPDNIQDLTDLLRTFFIEASAAGEKTLLIIDEAQKLSIEDLNQLNLLSQLEFTREKLLQIFIGKTAQCKDFLSTLDELSEAVYISKPKQKQVQFLKDVNEAFGINAEPESTKDLIDILNVFLLGKKAASKKVLLVIDESQDLSDEVLEQLDHFSKLESTQKKLLQIFLVGQPELDDLLLSSQASQLKQRITTKYQLTQLDLQGTEAYINHRISLASNGNGVSFDKLSFSAIYDYSLGNPRLINIACDRVLLKAFSSDSSQVTNSITKETLNDLTGTQEDKTPLKEFRIPRFAVASAALVPLIIALLYFANKQPGDISQPQLKAPGATQKQGLQLDSLPAGNALDSLNKTTSMGDDKHLPGKSSSEGAAHAVHAGAFATSSQARWRLRNIKTLGFPGFMYTDKTKQGQNVYVVIAGNYETADLANEASQKLNKEGYDNFIVVAEGLRNEGAVQK
jgi:type II secretory pathway predicted ATPase ExeA